MVGTQSSRLFERLVTPQGRPRLKLTTLAIVLTALGSCTGESGPTATATQANYRAPERVPITASPSAQTPAAQRLMRMNATEVVATLGEPEFKREENPAQIWRYRGRNCVLELMLYKLDRDYQVRHVETRDENFKQVAPDSCISSVSSAKRA